MQKTANEQGAGSNPLNTVQQKLLQQACDFLARREHTRKELHYKLAHACKNETLLEELLNKLSAAGLQSDLRFIEDFVDYRLNKGQGPLKIRQELEQRGVDQQLIADYLETDKIDWLSVAKKVRVKKFGEALPKDYRNQAKQSRFLYSRGFDSELINVLFKS